MTNGYHSVFSVAFLAHCYFCGTKLNVILVIMFTSQDLYSYKEKGHLKAKGEAAIAGAVLTAVIRSINNRIGKSKNMQGNGKKK